MKANELRIGNWIELDNDLRLEHKHNQRINKIRTIDCQLVSDENEYYGQLYEFIKPIPLTEEWLVRFGFTPDHNDYFFECEDHGVELEASWSSRNMQTGETFGWHISEYQHVKSVHQLQNLYFALTGEELKLNEETP
jgi:hypothetical protein